MKSTFAIKLILVSNYLFCRIHIYLNRNFHSNPTLSYSRFRYFTVDYLLNSIKVQVFLEKKHEKRHLCRHDKNYYYCWKSKVPAINLIIDSRNMIKVSKNMSLRKLDKWWKSFSPNTNNFLACFIDFDWGRILESAMGK